MNEVFHIGTSPETSELKKINKLLNNLAGDGNLSVTSYNVTKQNPVNITLNNETIYLKNNDCFGCVEVNINNSLTNFRLNPKSVIKIMNVENITLTAILTACDVEIIKGIEIEVKNNEPDIIVNNYMPNEYRCLSCAVNNVLYGMGKMVYISNDGGHTIAKTYDTNINIQQDYIVTGKISTTNPDKMIVFTNKGEIFLTIDGGNNWSNPDLSSIAEDTPVLPAFYNSCTWIGNNIVFGEYGTTSSRPYRIFKSNDNGATWAIALSKENISEIRHWHSIDYLHYSDKLIITSGDENANVKWFTANKDGSSFSEITGVNSQRYRTLRIQEYAPGEIIWGSDSNYRPWEVCTAKLSDVVDTTKPLADFNNIIYGIHKAGENIIVLTCVGGDAYQDSQATIYLSKDSGRTFKRVLSTNAGTAGFTSCVGVNKYGEFAITTNQIEGAIKTYHTFVKVNYKN